MLWHVEHVTVLCSAMLAPPAPTSATHAASLAGLCVGIEYTGLGERGRCYAVPYVGMAADARLTGAMSIVIEVWQVRRDSAVFMAGETSFVRNPGGVHREARLSGGVCVYLAECRELVRQTLGRPGVGVTLDVRDLGVRTLFPYLVVGGHLVTGRAERCLVGGPRRRNEPDRHDDNGGYAPEGDDAPVSEGRGDEASQ